MINAHFVIVGAIISFFGGLNYLISTVQGKTRPNRVSWFMWALAPLIAFAAELKSGVGLIALTTFMAGFMPSLIFISSFVDKKSVWQLTRFDLACGVLSIIGLCAWLLSGHGTVAIIFSIAADVLAAIPTLVKSYHDPESESWIAYFTVAISATISLLTVKVWTLANYGFPVYLLTVCTILVVLIKFEAGKRLSGYFAAKN